MQSDPIRAAQEIMALVDEFPSEPFSFERKRLEQRLTMYIERFANQVEDEYQSSFDIGYEEGLAEGRDESYARLDELENLLIEKENIIDELEGEKNQLQEENNDLAAALAEVVNDD